MKGPIYSAIIPGDDGNHGHDAQFDLSSTGCLGISTRPNLVGKVDRVYLTPAQVKALQSFLIAPVNHRIYAEKKTRKKKAP